MIKAIIFDCFGVLAEDGWMPIKRKYIGNNTSLAEQISDLGKQNEYGMIDNESHLIKMAKLIGIDSELLRTSLNKKVPNEELFDYIKTSLKPHYKIGLMSNANFNVLSDLFTPQQAKIFDASVMSYESRLIKPGERMFDLMAERLGVDVGECVFIDDQERYCVAAEEYGMQSIWYQDFEHFKHSLHGILES
jgi:HAD superfamily hydrolase (TIGR01509 family)